MKVKELKEILNRGTDDDELDIFVAPLVEMSIMDANSKEATKRLCPSPFMHYRVVSVAQSGALGNRGVYDLSVVFAYDDAVNHGLNPDEEEETDEFIN